MSRLVEPRPKNAKLGLISRSDRDSYLERVGKYVPAEIVAAYIALIGFAANVSPASKQAALIVIFGVCLVATPLYLWRMGKTSRVKAVHIVLSSLAFIVWAYAVGDGGIFGAAGLNIYDPNWASIVLVIFTLASGLIEPREAG